MKPFQNNSKNISNNAFWTSHGSGTRMQLILNLSQTILKMS